MKKDSHTICLLGIAFDNYNLGVGALADGAIRSILKCDQNTQISVLDYGYEPLEHWIDFCDGRVRIQFVNIRFSKKFYLRNNIAYLLLLAFLLKYFLPAALRKSIVKRNPVLSHLEGVDVFGSIAGGDSFSDIYGLNRLIYVSLPQILVLLMGKKLVLFPQTIGPFRGRFANWIAKYILSRADRVYSRDYRGITEVQRLLGNRHDEKVKFCYDVGFLAKPHPPSWGRLRDVTTVPDACVIGLNVSGLLYSGGYNRNNMFGLKVSYSELMRQIIRQFMARPDISLLLVPHVWRGTGPGDHLESDDQACRRIYNSLDKEYQERILLVTNRCNSNEIKHIIGTCNFFVGSRMHACIAALSQNIPTVAISYSDKFAGVMEALGLSEIVADLRTMDSHEILGIVIRSFDRRAELRQKLERTMPRVKEETSDLLKEIVSPSPSYSI